MILRRSLILLLPLITGFFAPPVSAQSDDIVTFESVPEELEDIVADEPLAKEFSAVQAARYIDRAALTWQKKKKCATCHTNMGYLFARPALAGV